MVLVDGRIGLNEQIALDAIVRHAEANWVHCSLICPGGNFFVDAINASGASN